MSPLHLSVENVGGIQTASVTVEDAVTLVTGENATNKTSLLRALLFGLGVDDVPIRTGAERAYVEVTIDGEAAERTAARAEYGIDISGDPLISTEDDAILFERFAGLLETNPLRTAVETTGDFEALLKEPMDIDDLERQRSEQLHRKRELQSRRDALGDVETKIETLTTKLEQHQEAAAALSTRLDSLYDELPDEDDELEALRTQWTELVNRRERLNAQIDDLEAAVGRYENDIVETERELVDAEETAGLDDMESLRQRRVGLREELNDIDERIDVLQDVLTANREILDTDMHDVFEYDAGLQADEIECWVCGQRARVSSIEETTDRLTTLIEREKSKRDEYKPEIAEIDERLASAEEATRQVTQLEARLTELREKRETRRSSLSEKREQLDDIEAELADVDARLETAREGIADAQSDVSEQIEETRADLEAEKREIERVEAQLSDLRDDREELAATKDELEELTDQIRELTTRIENLETDLRESFNAAMDDLVETLDFDGIERVWLDGDFDLVLAREVDGTLREDSIDHLAESERSMVGLVLGLAGYLAYDVGTIAPVLVLDSLGAFDAERTQRLVEYFGDHTDYLVAAVHPEQAETTGALDQLQVAPGQ